MDFYIFLIRLTQEALSQSPLLTTTRKFGKIYFLLDLYKVNYKNLTFFSFSQEYDNPGIDYFYSYGTGST